MHQKVNNGDHLPIGARLSRLVLHNVLQAYVFGLAEGWLPRRSFRPSRGQAAAAEPQKSETPQQHDTRIDIAVASKQDNWGSDIYTVQLSENKGTLPKGIVESRQNRIPQDCSRNVIADLHHDTEMTGAVLSRSCIGPPQNVSGATASNSCAQIGTIDAPSDLYNSSPPLSSPPHFPLSSPPLPSPLPSPLASAPALSPPLEGASGRHSEPSGLRTSGSLEGRLGATCGGTDGSSTCRPSQEDALSTPDPIAASGLRTTTAAGGLCPHDQAGAEAAVAHTQFHGSFEEAELPTPATLYAYASVDMVADQAPQGPLHPQYFDDQYHTPFALLRCIAWDAFTNAFPRGISQVCFMDNSVVGYLCFLALIWPSFGLSSGSGPNSMPATYPWMLALGTAASNGFALLIIIGMYWADTGREPPHKPSPQSSCSALSGTLMRMLASPAYGLWLHGLFGFNGALVGVAVATFTSTGANGRSDGAAIADGLLVIIGAGIATFLSFCLSNCWKKHALPTFTMPFNLAALIVLAAAIAFRTTGPASDAGIHVFNIANLPQVPWVTSNSTTPTPEWVHCFSRQPAGTAGVSCGSQVIQAIFRGISQVYFNDHWGSGLALALAFSLCSPIGAAAAFVGSGIGLGVGTLLGAHATYAQQGLLGYNAVISAMAVCGVFFRFSLSTAILSALTVVTSCFIQGLLLMVFRPIGLPILTLPFCLAALLVLTAAKEWTTRIAPANASTAERSIMKS